MKKKKESFISRIFNTAITLLLTFLMLIGLQSYSATSLKFVQLTDIHYYTGEDNTSFKLRAESPKLVDDAIEQINAMQNINFVMITGDLIDKSFEKELRALLPHLSKINPKWYFTFGNHDTSVGGYLTPQVFINMVKETNPDFTFDKSYYTFTPHKGYKVIVLDPIIRDRITSNGNLPQEQLDWVDEQIKISPDDTILIFMHNPIVEPFSSPNHRLLNAMDLDKILKKYNNPIGVFTGHYHAGRITQDENILYVNTTALVSYPNAFRVVTVTNHKNRVVFDIEMKETGLKNLQKLSRLLVFGSSIYTGAESDQTAVYEIKRKK